MRRSHIHLPGKRSCNNAKFARGSCFVVFVPDVRSAAAGGSADSAAISVTNPWRVSFAYMDGVAASPPAPVVMEALRDWTADGADGDAASTSLRYFSGTATYKTTVAFATGSFGVSEKCELGKHPHLSCNSTNLQEANAIGKTIKLSIGELPTGLAHVFVNGVDCGVVWCAPWEVDVSPAIRDGKNEIEIRYTNNWHNRLVGDCFLAPEDRVTRSSLRYWTKPRGWTNLRRPLKTSPSACSGPSVSDPLQPSGLIGPVAIRVQR